MIYPDKIVAVDIETTGVIPKYDFITMFAAVILDKGEVVGDPFYVKCRPDFERFKISPAALCAQVGDVRTEEGIKSVGNWLHSLMKEPETKDAALKLFDWSKANDAHKYPVVAHKADFDHAFYMERIRAFRSAFPTPPLSPVWIDTLDMARLADPGRRGYTVDDCLLRLKLEPRDVYHDALQDAMKAGQIYFGYREVMN